MNTNGNTQGKDPPSIIIEETKEIENSGAAPIQVKDSPSIIIDETKEIENSGAAPTDFTFSPRMHERNANATSSFQHKGKITFYSAVNLIIVNFCC